MEPNTPKESENGRQDPAPRKHSLEIKPEYKQTSPHYPAIILAGAGVAVGAALAIGYCTQRIPPMRTQGMIGTPSWRVFLEDVGEHVFSSEPDVESQGKSQNEAPVSPRMEESGKADGTE